MLLSIDVALFFKFIPKSWKMLLTYFYFSRNNMTELLMLKSKYIVSELLWQLFLDIFMFIFSTLSLMFVWSFLVFLDNRENVSKEESYGFTSRL